MQRFQKGAVAPIIIIIIIAVIVLGGGYFVYQYFSQNQEQNQVSEDEKYDFSKLNKDALLHKLFPNVVFRSGVADLVSSGDTIYANDPGLKLYLKDSIEDYFINTQKKSLLIVAQLDGVAHAGGLYHAYVGLFDGEGNLLTPSSSFPNPSSSNLAVYDFYLDKAQFGGDAGKFGFYDCKGVKHILFISSGCPNGTCCSDKATLYRINNGDFEKTQTVDQNLARVNNSFLRFLPTVNAAASSDYGLKMVLSGDKILLKKVPLVSDYRNCAEADYGEFIWNKNTCKFE